MNPLLTVKEAAGYLGVSTSTIYRYVSKSRIPCIQKPFGLRFRKTDLDEWLEMDKRDSFLPHKELKNLTYMTPLDIDMSKGGSTLVKVRALTFAGNGEFLSGTVYQRETKKGKRWCINFNVNGKRVRKVVPLARTEKEALFALQEEIKIAFNREYSIKKEREKVRFIEFSEIYLTNYAMVKKKSWSSDQKYIKAQLIPFFGELELSEINPLHVQKFMVKRQKDRVKNSTINRELTVLKKMLSLSIEWGYHISSNPVKKGNYFSEEQYKRNRVLSHEEEERLFRAAASHLKPILTCALTTGMRYSEILRLKWENCDMENRRITVKAESSKSGKARTVPFNDRLLSELRTLISQRKSTLDYVFTYEDPKTRKTRPLTTVRRAFNMACKRADILNFHFHDLRHTVASRLIEKGADPISVKNLLGHANRKTTEIYLHSSMKQMQETVNLLDRNGKVELEEMSPICHRFVGQKRERSSNAFFSVN